VSQSIIETVHFPTDILLLDGVTFKNMGFKHLFVEVLIKAEEREREYLFRSAVSPLPQDDEALFFHQLSSLKKRHK